MEVYLYYNDDDNVMKPVVGATVYHHEHTSGTITATCVAVTDSNGIATFTCVGATEHAFQARLHGDEVTQDVDANPVRYVYCDDPAPAHSINVGNEAGHIFTRYEHDIIPTIESFFDKYRSRIEFFACGDNRSNTTSFYAPRGDNIYIHCDATYTDTVLAHEFGHAFDNEALSGLVSCDPVPHTFDLRQEYGCAMNEGIADYITLATGYDNYGHDDSSYIDQHCVTYDASVEDCTVWGTVDDHLRVEGAIMAFLYDLTDSGVESYDNITISGADMGDILKTCRVAYGNGWQYPSRIHWIIHCIEGAITGYDAGFPGGRPSALSVSSGHSVSATDLRYLWRWHFFNKTTLWDPLAVLITGPDEVLPDLDTEDCLWTSSVFGGSGPKTYEWKRDNQTVGSYYWYTGETGSVDFDLNIFVSDSTATTSDVINVTVDSGSPTCP